MTPGYKADFGSLRLKQLQGLELNLRITKPEDLEDLTSRRTRRSIVTGGQRENSEGIGIIRYSTPNN